ncbi:GNAT family N-acetyltransferase [candidate division KSB1 bacterium]|nr:GNAT family N-acetyltransferase [candidate division KSB1 bacterium]
MEPNVLTAELCNTGQHFMSLKKEWTTLLETSEINDIFLTWEWLYSWWTVRASNSTLHIIVIREENRLVGIAPLMLVKRGIAALRCRTLMNLGGDDADVAGFITRQQRPDIFKAIADYLLQTRKHWDILSIHDIPRFGFDRRLFRSFFPQNRFHFFSIESSQYSLQTNSSWDEFHRSLSKNLRKDLRKKIKRLQALGKVEFQRFRGKAVTRRHLDTVFQIQSRSYRPQLLQHRLTQKFHLNLMNAIKEHGWLDVSFLLLDEMPIAYRYGFGYQNRYEDWITGFDNRFFAYSCGKILLMNLIRDCFEDDTALFHFLRGEEEYKKLWNIIPIPYIHKFTVSNHFSSTLMHIKFPAWKNRVRHHLENKQSLKPIMARYDKIIGNN